MQMSYSKTGKDLATTYFTKAKSIGCDSWTKKRTYGWGKQDSMLMDGFDKIIKSPDTTDDEKKLAQLGKAFGKHAHIMFSWSNCAEARYVIMNALMNPLCGDVGVVIAKLTCDAANQAWDNTADPRAILKDGFNAIINNDKTTEDEKTIAKLGNTVGEHIMIEEHYAAKARSAIMKVLSQSINGPIGKVILQATNDANIAMRYADEAFRKSESKEKCTVFEDGFNTIINNNKTTEEEKTVAKLANTIINDRRVSPENAVKASYAIIDFLNSSVGGPIDKVLAKASLAMVDEILSIDYYGRKSNLAIYQDGLKAIANNPDTPERTKEIALKGFNAEKTSDVFMDYDDSRSLKDYVMHTIAELE